MPAKHALVIGVDNYVNLAEKYQLGGCVNDAKLMKNVLIEHFNFDNGDIAELHNEDASRRGILAEMEALVEKTGKDDIVVFHYSGHGSQRTAVDPEESSGLDSTIMPYDSGRDPHPNLDIIDDEIHDWLGRLSKKTRYITLTFDCCHSGTITRDVFGAKTRSVAADRRSLKDMGIDPAQLPKTKKSKKRDVGPSGWLALSDSYVVMSGCRDNELASEHETEDAAKASCGALTYFLSNALMNAKPGTTYRDVFEIARRSVSSIYTDQNPQIEGAQDREIYGVRDIEPIRFISIAAVDGDQVTLNGGAAHGLHGDSRWGIYPQGTKQTKGTKPLGELKIESVGPLTAHAVVSQSSGEIEAGARCVEEVPATSQFQLRVDSSALVEGARVELEKGIEKSDLLLTAKSPRAADVRAYVLEPREKASKNSPVPQVAKVETPTWAVVDRQGALAMPLHPASEKDVVKTLIGNLETTARYRNALALTNPNGDLNVEFNIYRQTADGELEDANGGDFEFDAGDCIVFEVVNNEDVPVFVSVLDFGLMDGIRLLYPPNKTSERIEQGQTLKIGAGERKIRLSVPKKFTANHGTETFKAFITSDESDFSWLQQAGTRAAENTKRNSARSALRQQFEAAYLGPVTRDAGLDPVEETDNERWVAIGRSFMLRKQQI